ncbi:hypothetical protein EVAR_98755_1 [Eumeta japonica]|uniref:Uncharacterized protein n=1 Tax=Eumeta variegata TaxID=151549 RepID=A0A4C1YZ53_EUMVA|nr:hypothetical protein EVAR_98755_1 [Eumeta japonica]
MVMKPHLVTLCILLSGFGRGRDQPLTNYVPKGRLATAVTEINISWLAVISATSEQEWETLTISTKLLAECVFAFMHDRDCAWIERQCSLASMSEATQGVRRIGLRDVCRRGPAVPARRREAAARRPTDFPRAPSAPRRPPTGTAYAK